MNSNYVLTDANLSAAGRIHWHDWRSTLVRWVCVAGWWKSRWAEWCLCLFPPGEQGPPRLGVFVFLEACFLGGVGHRLGIIQTLLHLFPCSFSFRKWMPMCIFIATFSFLYDTQSRIQPWHFTSPFLILVKFIRSYELRNCKKKKNRVCRAHMAIRT